MLQSIANSILEQQKTNKMIPYIYAIISCTTVVLMQLNMKIVTQTLSPIYALYARGFGLLVLNSLIIRSSGIKIDLKDPELFRMIVKRSFYTSVALICFLGSTPFIPIAIVNSLYNVGPILIFFIESYVLKKKIDLIHFGLTVMCFLGILLIIKPQFLFGTSDQQWPMIFLIFPLIGACFSAYATFLLHELRGKTKPQITLQYFYLLQMLCTGIMQNFTSSKLPEHFPFSFWMSFIGLIGFAFLTQNLFTRAVFLKKASHITPFQYWSIIVATPVDITIFNEHFDYLSLIGIMLASVGLLLKLLSKQ